MWSRPTTASSSPWSRWWTRDRLGRLEIGRDYRVATDEEVTAGIYVQGATEHTHGLASTLLSNVAVRNGEIAASIVARRPARPAADLARSVSGA